MTEHRLRPRDHALLAALVVLVAWGVWGSVRWIGKIRRVEDLDTRAFYAIEGVDPANPAPPPPPPPLALRETVARLETESGAQAERLALTRPAFAAGGHEDHAAALQVALSDEARRHGVRIVENTTFRIEGLSREAPGLARLMEDLDAAGLGRRTLRRLVVHASFGRIRSFVGAIDRLPHRVVVVSLDVGPLALPSGSDAPASAGSPSDRRAELVVLL